MSDFGDEVGSDLKEKSVRWLADFLREMQRLRERRELMEQRTQHERGQCGMDLRDNEQADAVMQALDARGIPYDVRHTSLGEYRDGGLQRKITIQFDEKDFDAVEAAASAKLREKAGGERTGAQAIRSHDGADVDSRTTVVESVVDAPGDASATREPQNHVYTDEIAAKVEEARAGSATREEFAARCKAAGLGVSLASDGELKFSHPDHPWFEVRADTLGGQYSARSFDLRGKEPEDGEIGIDLDRAAKDAQEVSSGLAQERGMNGFERYIPNFQNISR